IIAYARSTVTGTYNQQRMADIIVGSQLLVTIDTPAPSASVGQPFQAKGWSIDLSALSGTGVDGVQFWAMPAGGGAGQFLGQATLGGRRPDVGAAYGSQFTLSGFSVNVTGLAPGVYDLYAYAHSTVTGIYDRARFARITITVSSAPAPPVKGKTS